MNIKKTNIEGTELKILVLEDSTRDLELMRELLSNEGYRLDLTHVENKAGFTASLRENSFDLILADFKLPDFDGFGALQISRELCPETPFICVSGTIGEETAVELLKLGAMDYVLKDRPERLPYAVKRALEEAKAKADYQKAEKALRISEEKLRSIYRVAPAGIGVVSNRLLKEVNPHVCEMTGYTREELIDKNARILYPTQEEYEFVGKKKYDEIKEKGIGEVETRWQKKDGSIINVLLASTFIDKNDHSKEVIFTALDITERKQAEEEKATLLNNISERNKELNFLFQVSRFIENPEASLESILQDTTLMISQAWQYPEMTCARIVLEGKEYKTDNFQRTKWEQSTAVIINGKDAGKIEVCYLGKKPEHYKEIFLKEEQELLDTLGRLLGDITESKKAEEALRESEEKHRALIEQMQEGLLVVDNDDIIKFTNPAFCKMLGYKEDELLGRVGYDVLINENDRGLIIQKNLERQQLISEKYELNMLTKSGDQIVMLMNANPVLDNKGMVTGSMSTCIDITERKHAEEALREKIDLLERVFDSNFDLISLSDIKGNFTLVGKAHEILGYDSDYLIGKNIIEFVHPEDVASVIKEFSIFLKTGEKRRIDYRYKRIDGTYLWFETIGTILIDNKGKPEQILFNTRNITKRKQAEKIKQVEYNIAQATITTRNLNELFDSIKIELNSIIDVKNFVIALYNEETGMLNATVDRDEKGEIPEWSAEKSLTGYAIKQNRPVLLQKNEILRLHKEGIIELIGTTAEAWLGVPLKVEGEILGAVIIQDYDNPDVYNQTSIEIMELVAHELSMFIDRQRSEEKAIKLSRAVEQSSVSIMITNREGTIEYVNPFFEELTGYSFEEVKGKNSNILNSGRQSQAFYKELWDTILSGNDWEGEMLNKKKNEDLYWEKAVISPIVNSEGVITNFVAIKEDITERKKMLEELVIAKEKAEESDKLKTAFINNISHEIRTPLNGILGFGTILSETDPSPEDKKEMLAYLQQSGNRLMNTMTDYMDIAHIVSGTMEVHKKEFLLQPVFVEVIEENMQLFTDKKIGFEADYQNNFELTLDSDPALIKRVLNILLDNALKFTTEGSIRCGYKVKEKFVEFFVQDTGKGIAPEKLDAIFNNFIQEDTLATRAYEGSGLGLSITSGLVKLLGGTISVTSEPEVGSTFTFTVPIKIARR